MRMIKLSCATSFLAFWGGEETAAEMPGQNVLLTRRVRRVQR